MNKEAQVIKLPRGIALCECAQYQVSGTCQHISPQSNTHWRYESGNQKQTPESGSVAHSSLKDDALEFQEFLKSQGIPSELRKEGKTFAVFFKNKGYKGNTYSYVKLFF
jgi:hypothetical protein